ncbi:MAG TPA: hypothetical protein VGH28_07665 [Polyangiaceae bacterium]|jgi:hypothetical protein
MKLARSIAFAAFGGAGLALVLGAAKPAAKKAPPPPTQPPPQVSLTLVAPIPDRGWTVTLSNTGTDPVRIVADPRLVSFDVTSAGHDVHCALPADMRPSTDTVDTLAVPPGRSWSARIDPTLYCFAGTAAAALVPGATVTATFGFSPAGNSPPYALTPIGGDGGVGPARQVTAPVVTLAAAQTLADAGAPQTAADSAAPPSNRYPVHVKIALPARLDTWRAFEQNVTVTITNDTDRTIRTLIAAPTLGFVIQTPEGHVYHCGADTPATAIAELVTTLRPHGRTAQSVDIGAVCGTFLRQPGLYRVRPRLDTRQTTPPPGPGEFWNGQTVGDPMLLRIRAGEDPPESPRLDPPPPAVP